MEEVIKVSNLTRKYKDFSLGPVDLSFPKGFATALIGANGAGKTTLMDIICGITAKTDGTATYFGETDNADSGNIKERIGYCASQAMFPANWKVRDIALSMSLAFDKFSKDRFYSLLGELGVTDEKNSKKPLSSMSDGMKMRVFLASAFARETDLLVLDEPGSSLDPLMRDRLCDRFRDYIDSGNGERSIIFSTHNIADMENAADYVIFMDNGKVVEQGFTEDLKDKYIALSAEPESLDKISPLLLCSSHSSSTATGLALAENKLKLEALGAVTERPTLSQLSIDLMKIAEEKRLALKKEA